MPAEAADITAIQRASLGADAQLADLLSGISVDEMISAWHGAITRPPLASYRVLVALDSRDVVVGFAAIGPSDDEDAEPTDGLVAEFCVHPDHRDQGHEDRLMHAVADTLKADGFTRATWWVATTDDATRALLTESGWDTDGAHHEVGDEGDRLRVKQVRLHTALV